MASRSHDFSRRRPRRAERSRLLIVTEGVVTEVQYLEGLAQFLRSTGTAVRGVRTKGIGRDPVRVLRAAIEIHSVDPAGYDEIWVLVDVDEHALLPAALEEAARSKVPMVVSNPCFEIWLLWHYQDCASHQSVDDLERKLEKHGHDGKQIPVRFPYDAYRHAVVRGSGSQESGGSHASGRQPVDGHAGSVGGAPAPLTESARPHEAPSGSAVVAVVGRSR